MNDLVIEVADVHKVYDGVAALAGVSFTVQAGEIFGLLGPNGAGKTTTIRILMDIIKPDAGTARVLGQPPGAARNRVGYLPEERGLYRNLRLLDCLTYLAELKGMPGAIAQARAKRLLERLDLADWERRKINELSRGMQQKAQLIASLVHDPQLVLLDEPFQGLDPLNVEIVKEVIRELQAQGKTVVLSTHMMNQVEALCDRILLINRGQAVLYGPLAEIKRRYAPNTVRLRSPQPPGSLPGIVKVEEHDRVYELYPAEGTTSQMILQTLVERGVPVESFEVATAPMEQVFIAVVGGEKS